MEQDYHQPAGFSIDSSRSHASKLPVQNATAIRCLPVRHGNRIELRCDAQL
jgi:hypothetical protein